MPRYTYHCQKCDTVFEYYHSMSEKKTYCDMCNEETLLKVPTFNGMIKKETTNKPGSIVENYIEEAREEIKKEKEELKKLEYKIK